MFRPVGGERLQMGPGLSFPEGPPVTPANMMNADQATEQGGMNMELSALPPAIPPIPPPSPAPGRAFLLPAFGGSLPGFPPLPTTPSPLTLPPLPPSPATDVPPPPPTFAEEESNSVNSAASTRIPQDPETVKNIEVLAAFVARDGPQFEQMTKSKQRDDPKFAFLFGGERDSEAAIGLEYYEWRKELFLEKQRKEDDECLSAKLVKDTFTDPSKQEESIPSSPTRSDMDMEEDKHAFEDSFSGRPFLEKGIPEAKELQTKDAPVVTMDLLGYQKEISSDVHFEIIDQIPKKTPNVVTTIESPSAVLHQEKESNPEMPDTCMEDVGPLESPLKSAEEIRKRNLVHLLRTKGKTTSTSKGWRWGPEIEAQPILTEANYISSVDDEKPDVKVSDELETFPSSKRYGSSSSTSDMSKQGGLTFSADSDCKIETGNTDTVRDGQKPDVEAPEVDEFGRLVRGGSSDSDSKKRFPLTRGRSKSRSRSRTPMDLRGRSPGDSGRQYRSRSPRRNRSDSRSCSLSPRRCRSRSRSPSRDYRRGGDFRGNRGFFERGRRGVQGRPVCIHFMRGRCFRGRSCWFSHRDYDIGVGDRGWRWEDGPMGGGRDHVMDEDRHGSRAEDSPSRKVKEESKEQVQVPEGHDGQNAANVSAMDEAKCEQVSFHAENTASNLGPLSPPGITNTVHHFNSSVHSKIPIKEERESTVEDQPVQSFLFVTTPSVASTLPQQDTTSVPSMVLPPLPQTILPSTDSFREKPHRPEFEANSVHSESETSLPLPLSKSIPAADPSPQQRQEQGYNINLSRPQPRLAPPLLSSLPPRPSTPFSGIPSYRHGHRYAGNSVRPQRQHQHQEFLRKNMLPQTTGFSNQPFPSWQPVLGMHQPQPFRPELNSSPFTHHVSNASSSHFYPQQPVFSPPTPSIFQPGYGGIPHTSQQPVHGMNLPAVVPRYDEPPHFMPQPGPRPPVSLHQQTGFLSQKLPYPPPSSSHGSSNAQPPGFIPQNIQNLPRQQQPMFPDGSYMQAYPRQQVPAPVSSSAFNQSHNFTFSIPNLVRVPMQSPLPMRQQQQLSEDQSFTSNLFPTGTFPPMPQQQLSQEGQPLNSNCFPTQTFSPMSQQQQVSDDLYLSSSRVPPQAFPPMPRQRQLSEDSSFYLGRGSGQNILPVLQQHQFQGEPNMNMAMVSGESFGPIPQQKQSDGMSLNFCMAPVQSYPPMPRQEMLEELSGNVSIVPARSFPPLSQQKQLFEESYPITHILESEVLGAVPGANSSFLQSAPGNTNDNPEESNKDEIYALELSNRILSAARAGVHVLDSVNPKPATRSSEDEMKRPSKSFERLFASQTLKDQVHSKLPILERIQIDSTDTWHQSQIDLSSPVYAIDDPEDAAVDEVSADHKRERAIGESDDDLVRQQSKGKSSKEAKTLKFLRMAITEYVKEVLKPNWREGHLSKEAFKTIVKKSVDKVIATLPSHHVPKSEDNIDRFIISSQEKISKLVQGYLDKYLKA